MDYGRLLEKLPPFDRNWSQYMQERWLWAFCELLRMSRDQSLTVTDTAKLVVVQCPHCDWGDAYTTQANAARALSSHMRQMHKLQYELNGTDEK
jgi:hypothetical protein